MTHLNQLQEQIRKVNSFEELVFTPFYSTMNAICWERSLIGDFAEIVRKLETAEHLVEIDPRGLRELELTEQGQKACTILLNDFNLLRAHGASPSLNLIKHYERDDFFFPTDVYSFHVDQSPIPTSTYLCTYHGAASEILPNSHAEQKVIAPEIRAELKKIYDGPDHGFDAFLTEHFFDLHYQAKPDAEVINLGQGYMWRLAVDHPESNYLPCVHRAPAENDGETRLLLIC